MVANVGMGSGCSSKAKQRVNRMEATMATRMEIREKHAIIQRCFYIYSFWYFSVCGPLKIQTSYCPLNVCDFFVPQPEATFRVYCCRPLGLKTEAL